MGQLRDWIRQMRPEATAAAEVRHLADSGRVGEALRAARGGSPGVLRALRGAFAGGALSAHALAEARLPPPRSDEDHLLDALARARSGEGMTEVRERLAARDGRKLDTAFGPRHPVRAIAIAPLLARFDTLAPDLLHPRDTLRATLAPQAERDPNAWLRLAGLRHPDDAAALLAARTTAGRRGDHTLLEAMGIHGDPRFTAALQGALHARDVDPARGFIQRRLAADGLGRLGLAQGERLLLRALDDERTDFEGRPGAGLGIQYPVRANLLWALGELGSTRSVPTLIGYLGNSTGSAFGGFYLPAMDALVRIGAAARPALERATRSPHPEAATNARCVLAAIASDP